mgnify:CR=1 FL=1
MPGWGCGARRRRGFPAYRRRGRFRLGGLSRFGRAGWGGAAGLGLLCFFAKDTDGKQEALAIVAATDDATKKTQVFFVRVDVSSLETPTP